jgi:hypothetical protein
MNWRNEWKVFLLTNTIPDLDIYPLYFFYIMFSYLMHTCDSLGFQRE